MPAAGDDAARRAVGADHRRVAPESLGVEDAKASADQRRRAWYAGCMSSDLIATVLTGVGVLAGVWAIVERKVEGVRRDLGAQIEGVRRDIGAVNTRIDNILLADRGRDK